MHCSCRELVSIRQFRRGRSNHSMWWRWRQNRSGCCDDGLSLVFLVGSLLGCWNQRKLHVCPGRYGIVESVRVYVAARETHGPGVSYKLPVTY